MKDALTLLRAHGGRLGAACAHFPNAPRPWLDLSTGVNPEPWSGPRASDADLARLPDPMAIAALEAAAARTFGAEPACVAAVTGAEAGLRLVPALTGARSAAIASPTYGGHAQAWRNAGVEPRETPLRALAGSGAEVLVAVNPNNPDGATCAPAELAVGNRWLVVDESFVEVAPELSVAGLGLPRTLVLRSFGKFYGLPGVRLGFIVAEAPVAARARTLVGDWPVGADAVTMGTAAYLDRDWQAATRRALAAAADRLDRLLSSAGFAIVGGTSLFRLTHAPDAARRFLHLAERGILVRPFDYDDGLLRFGLPPADGWDRLAAALNDL